MMKVRSHVHWSYFVPDLICMEISHGQRRLKFLCKSLVMGYSLYLSWAWQFISVSDEINQVYWCRILLSWIFRAPWQRVPYSNHFIFVSGELQEYIKCLFIYVSSVVHDDIFYMDYPRCNVVYRNIGSKPKYRYRNNARLHILFVEMNVVSFCYY